MSQRTKNYGDTIVPLDGFQDQKTEIALKIDKLFTAILTVRKKGRSIGCRVVPSEGFVTEYGAKTASLVELYLTDVKSGPQPTYVSLILIEFFDKFDNYLQSDIHLDSFYSLIALTSSQGIEDLVDDLKVPKSIFKGIALKTLHILLNFCMQLNPELWSKDKIIGFEADGKIPGALKNEKGVSDKSLLGKYYMTLGFKPLDSKEEEKIRQGSPIFGEIRMNGRLGEIFSNISKIVS